MKKTVVLFLMYVIIVICFTNLIELAYCNFINHTSYKFELVTCLIIPLSVALVTGFILFFSDSRKNKKISKEKIAVSAEEPPISEDENSGDDDSTDDDSTQE